MIIRQSKVFREKEPSNSNEFKKIASLVVFVMSAAGSRLS